MEYRAIKEDGRVIPDTIDLDMSQMFHSSHTAWKATARPMSNIQRIQHDLWY